MKILVLDDSFVNRKSARATLKDHDLVVVGTFDEAMDQLDPYWHECQIRKKLLIEHGFDEDDAPYLANLKNDEDRKSLCQRLHEEAKQQASILPFDAVLLDLLIPASSRTMGEIGEQYIGKKSEGGNTLALRAIALGIRYVAVVTDMNHHNHPASAAFDRFPNCKRPDLSIFCTNDPEFILMDCITWELVTRDFLNSPEGKVKYPENGCDANWNTTWEDIEYGKDWGWVLEKLMG